MDTSKAQPSSVPVQESRHAVEKDTTSLSGVPDAHLPSTEQRLERVFRFDTSRYNFRQIIFDIFCTAPQVGEQLRAAALQDSNDIGIALSRVHEVQNKFWQSRGLNSSQAVPSQASSSRGGPPPLHKNNNSQQQEPCKKIPRHDPKAMKKKASKKCAKKLKKSSFYSVRPCPGVHLLRRHTLCLVRRVPKNCSLPWTPMSVTDCAHVFCFLKAYVLHTSKRCSPKKVDGQAANNVLKSTSRGPASSADCPTSRKAIGATAGDTSPADVATNSVAASVSATGHFEDLYSQFHSTLKRFVREVVAPLLGVGADDVLYQRYPTLRISPPASTAMGSLPKPVQFRFSLWE